MLDVLMYLIENCTERLEEHEGLAVELKAAGFDDSDVYHALCWLGGLFVEQTHQHSPTRGAIRHYTPEEQAVLGKESINYLNSLEKIGILSPRLREHVLDRAMALGVNDLNPSHIQWVALMVLFSEPDQKNKLEWMQEVVMSDARQVRH